MIEKDSIESRFTPMPNQLVHETSPYLLQHAYNPVNWYPWGESALQKAKEEDKPIIVSIGYSSCHWCHVMEKESFENLEIAGVMNEYYINIKVDREERPDIDQIYMEAIQTMNIHGGWPLNVVLTPEGKPFYGGTYFPPLQWKHLLEEIAAAFQKNRDDLEISAERFVQSLNVSELEKYGLKEDSGSFTQNELDTAFSNFSKNFDPKHGGKGQEPKFSMPSNWLFLLRYYHLSQNQDALNQTKLTLTRMAMGGIYDQIGGGFARYSTDEKWFAPHFEKMLYDNGQLVSLYSEAYQITEDPLYKTVVYDTIEWLEREMSNTQGGFYSALDADTEGMEGRFYVWEFSELKNSLGDEFQLFSDYYTLKENGNWEKGYNILHRTLSNKAFCNKHQITMEELERMLVHWKETLLISRNKRETPALDDKVLCSWNGLTIKGLCDAYRAFEDEKFRNLATKTAQFIRKRMIINDQLMHTYKNEKATIPAFLDDYAYLINGLIALYEVTFDKQWILLAKKLTDKTIKDFFDPNENLFFYTSDKSEKLIARKKEIFDNVTPGSNSSMAINLYKLGLLYYNDSYLQMSKRMLARVKKLIMAEPTYTSNWAILAAHFVTPTAEIAIIGETFQQLRQELEKIYFPNKVIAGSKYRSELPILKGKSGQSHTRIFVCYNKTCKTPVSTTAEAINLLKN